MLMGFSFLDSSKFDHVAIHAIGRSGGLLSLWDNKLYKVKDVIKSRDYLITIGSWVGILGETIFANVYIPQASSEKKRSYGMNSNI